MLNLNKRVHHLVNHPTKKQFLEIKLFIICIIKTTDGLNCLNTKKVLRILDYVLKVGSYDNEAPYYLYNISARCPLKGNPGQQLHVDSELPGLNYNIVTNVMWYFDDVDELNGTTIIVPGSHKLKKFAPRIMQS